MEWGKRDRRTHTLKEEKIKDIFIYCYGGRIETKNYNRLFFSYLLSADCLTWNATIAIWNASLPDQIGTLIDRFCPEISAKEYILNITTNKIVIRWVIFGNISLQYLFWEMRVSKAFWLYLRTKEQTTKQDF